MNAPEDPRAAPERHGAADRAAASDLALSAIALALAAAAVYGAWRISASHAPIIVALTTGYAGLVGLGIVLAFYHRRRQPDTARTLGANIGAELADTFAMGSMESVQLTALALPWLAAAIYGASRLLPG